MTDERFRQRLMYYMTAVMARERPCRLGEMINASFWDIPLDLKREIKRQLSD